MRINNNLPQFQAKLYLNLDMGFRELAKDILIESQNKAPFKRGPLRTDSDINHVGIAHWQVRYHKEYARYQEAGGDGNRVVRKYSTSGTGKGFLADTGNKIFGKAIMTLKQHAGRTR